MTEALSIHHRLERGLSSSALDGIYIKTMTAVDFRGHPFVNITFTAPRPIEDIWSFADTLTGNEWSYDDFETPWTTTLTGATTIRDVLITSNEGVILLLKMNKTLKALGGAGNLKDVIGFELQNFVMRDNKNNLWDVETSRLLTNEEGKQLKATYDAIYRGNNSPEAERLYKKLWKDTLDNSKQQLKQLGYVLEDFASEDGGLNLGKLSSVMTTLKADELHSQVITDGGRSCVLFVCTAYQYGQVGHTPYSYSGLQATQGGFQQKRGDYITGATTNFNSIVCINNSNVSNVFLGCGPSAFIGLVGRKFNDGYTIDGMKKTTHAWSTLRRRLVDPVGINGRARIANYMGTCEFGGGGLTTGGGFASGGNSYLYDATSNLKLYSNVSHYFGNIIASNAKADMIMREVGRENNPVVAEYFIGQATGHYAPIAQYWIRQGATTYIDIKTPDHQDRWWSLTGGWGTERGVFYIDPR